tara:strand:+ start:426 stop:890 length:465 start_codon:yes stop_codon:yes gene_type:complete
MRGIIKRKKIGNKKGLSPMVSTVLLIMIIIIIAIIILIWGRGFIKEKLLKFSKPVKNVCADVDIKPFVNEDNSYGFTNSGNVAIYQIDLKTIERGKSTITRIKESVSPGGSIILGNDYLGGNVEEIKVIPILLGKTSSGKTKEYTCKEINAIVI